MEEGPPDMKGRISSHGQPTRGDSRAMVLDDLVTTPHRERRQFETFYKDSDLV
jgi:hypothetical protein